jgi:hypothetical protein
MSGAFGSQKSKTASKSQSDPWDVAIPALTDLVGKIRPMIGQNAGPTADQQTAIDQIKTNAAAGNPYADDLDTLANDTFGAQSQSGTVTSAYDEFQRRLNPVADGANLDIMNNPHLMAMLEEVGGNARNAVNSSFAAFGGGGSRMAKPTAISRGVTQAQLPLLLDQFNREQGRTDAAGRDLFAGGNTAASAVQGLDQAALDQRAKGADIGQAALDAENWGPNAILNLDEQVKNMPADWLAKIASILYPAGQLGQQEQGNSSTKGSGFKLGFSL